GGTWRPVRPGDDQGRGGRTHPPAAGHGRQARRGPGCSGHRIGCHPGHARALVWRVTEGVRMTEQPKNRPSPQEAVAKARAAAAPKVAKAVESAGPAVEKAAAGAGK